MRSNHHYHILKWVYILFFIAGSNLIFVSFCLAQTKQKILIFTGGHKFEREAFFNIFENMDGIEFKEVSHPDANQLYDSDLIKDFDVLLFYDMVQEIDDSQKAAFKALLQAGKGVVFLHHSLLSYQGWEEYEKIIGGRYIISKTDESYGSNYRHDVKIPVKIVSKNHPITKEMNDFVIHDEVYGNFRVSPKVSQLLTTTHPESGKTIGWTNEYGKSRIVYIQLGHDHFAYDDSNYRLLIKQSISWVSHK